jgi:predicted nucleotidyltransferase|tara:strand:- start:355 stop:522 length:168 start_codon:yes stop_codon:yes gene_type:complete
MENSTSTNGMQIKYVEAKQGVEDVKLFSSVLKQCEMLTSQIEILRKAVESLIEKK